MPDDPYDVDKDQDPQRTSDSSDAHKGAIEDVTGAFTLPPEAD